MPLSLYQATVPSYIQIVGSMLRLVGKAEEFCAEKGLPADDILNACLAEDMLPFAYQVKSVTVHSINAINAVYTGSFGPDMTPPPSSFEGLKAQLEATLAALQAIAPADIDAVVGRDMVFALGERRLEFTAENFLLSFSQPNFYFHATTAYDILRSKGMAIGKRDFIGALRLKPAA
ncbi:DUF1993 domain-containing protein [Sphingobium sp. SCG-1]|uniref:DUF1993 domain-containing protein n=1 Tax=Sphingobium sp. SCG-1 TaxID=2072936 RepID=UPI000CD6B180|nr:DUF1993 domain-containing protein [Sphingobium sp. SCG-1]AUW59853.1 DUF1993 domain-containing protein [Sphingobium sp. SCG-1]